MSKTMLKKNIQTALGHLRTHKKLLIANISILMVATLFEGFGIGMLMPILQSMTDAETNNFFIRYTKYLFEFFNIQYGFMSLIIIFTTVMLSKYILVALQQYLSRVLSATMIFELRDKAFNNLMELPLSFYYRNRPGDLVSTIYVSANNAGALIDFVLMMTKGGVFACAYITINCLISLPLTAVTMALAAVSYFFIYPRFQKVYNQGSQEKYLTDEINSFLHDTLSGIKILKAFNNEKNHIDDFRKTIGKYRIVQIKIMLNKILATFMLEPFAFVLMIMILVFAFKVLGISLVSLVVFLFIFSQLIPKVKLIINNYLQINELLPHFAKLQEIIERDNKHYLPRGSKSIKKFDRNIQIENVFFRYPEGEEDVLKNINILIEKFSTVALIGASGGGKTTLVDLILRHHDPSRGFIKVDGKLLKDINPKDWHKLVGVVDQDPYLFNNTVYNNILYGNKNADDGKVYDAAKMAYAHDFITKLPEKYDTVVGNRGIKLSGGQKQRISLARALIRDPEILILDEATSSLDSESEELIQRSIREIQKKKTVIVIAHRLSTIKNSDKIVIIENGMVVDEGNHRTLSEKKGRYTHYLALQSNADQKPILDESTTYS